MELNLVQHRAEASVWDQLERRGWDAERWLISIAAGAVLVAGVRRRSPAGLLLTLCGGALTWWAAKGLDERSGWREQVRAALPHPRAAADLVSEASEESFPASDAPAWTPTTGNTSTCNGARSR
jgi:hypothetical protein